MTSIRSQLICWQFLLLACLVVGFGWTLDRQVHARAVSDFDLKLSTKLNQLKRVVSPRIDPAFIEKLRRKTETAAEDSGGPWWKKSEGLPPGQMKKLQSSIQSAKVDAEKFSQFLAAHPDLGFVVWNAAGKLIKSSRIEPESGFAAFHDPHAEVGDSPRMAAKDGYRYATRTGGAGSQVVVFESTTRLVAEQKRLRRSIIMIGLAVLVVGLLGAFFLSRQIVKPIERMAMAVGSISADNPQRLELDSSPRELVELCKPINDAFDRLDEAYQREKQFAANASHELRTPLAVLTSQTELVLSHDRSPQEYREGLEVCARAIHRMNGLVQRLTLTGGKRSDFKSQPAEIDLRQLVLECVEQLKPSANHRQIRFETDLETATVTGDPKLLGQLVTHLIVNAICHNKQQGSVSVTLSNHESSVQLCVADNGPGISDADQSRVFEPFYSTDPSRMRDNDGDQGFGLGLTICRRVADAHDGEISLSSEPNKGTTVLVSLPKTP